METLTIVLSCGSRLGSYKVLVTWFGAKKLEKGNVV